MTEDGAVWAIGVLAAGGVCSLPLTPHLTSPLVGGRDELGKGWVLGWVGSCLRRNDGGGAGMTEEWCWVA